MHRDQRDLLGALVYGLIEKIADTISILNEHVFRGDIGIFVRDEYVGVRCTRWRLCCTVSLEYFPLEVLGEK